MLDEETYGLMLRLCIVDQSLFRYLSKRALRRLAEIDSMLLDLIDIGDDLGLVYGVGGSQA